MKKPQIEILKDINGIDRYYRDGIRLEKGAKLSEEDIDNNFELYKYYFQLFTAYPDIFIDLITPVSSNFQLYPYQRLYLRACLRYRYQGLTACRAFSKSFISILGMILKCIFQPGGKFFICAPKKEQSAKIAKEKLSEIFELFPLLRKELVGNDYNAGADYVSMTFRNGSIFDVVGALDSTRGGRRHGGILDESRDHSPDQLNEIVIPLMNVNRKTAAGIVNPYEPHQSQIWITSAGAKNTFAYDKMIELLTLSIMFPSRAFYWGCDYRIPVMHGLLDKTFIDEIKMSPTFKESSFSREYCSIWTGSSSDSWFDYDKLIKRRKILNPETSKKVVFGTKPWYLISVDVARLKCQTVATVFKVIQQPSGSYKIKVVNIYVQTDTGNKMHFQEQACFIKELIERFDPIEVVIDGNGLGVGLMDFMVIETIGSNGKIYPPYGTFNDKSYFGLQAKDAPKIIYVMKDNASFSSDIHSAVYSEITNNNVEFLATEKEIKSRLLATKKGQKMRPEDRAARILPHELTSRLFDEILNLRLKQAGAINKIELEMINKRMTKDKFSSLEYGIYRIKMRLDENKKKEKRKIGTNSRLPIFFTRGN